MKAHVRNRSLLVPVKLMAASAPDSAEQGREIMAVTQSGGEGFQTNTFPDETERPLDTQASSKAGSLATTGPDGGSPAENVQVCMDKEWRPDVGNGLINGPTGSPDNTTHRKSLPESNSQRDEDANQISDVRIDKSQKKTARSRKNPTPKKVLTPPKSAPSRPRSKKKTPQTKKRRGKKPKAETLSPTENPLTSSPARTPHHQLDAPEEQGMTPPPQKKKCGRKPKGWVLTFSESPLTSTPTTQNQRDDAPEEQEITPSGRPRRRAAKAAIEYLHKLAEDMDSLPRHVEGKDKDPRPNRCSDQPKERTQSKGKKGQKRKTLLRDDSDSFEDEDFLPVSESASEEDDIDDDDISVSSIERLVTNARHETSSTSRSLFKPRFPGQAANGLMNSIMGPVWCCASVTKQFREEHCASWVFPEWIPSAKDWLFLSESIAEKYLPTEKLSPAFRISREGLNEEGKPCRLKRFESLPSHADRWDMCFFVGGPVWSMEWCPSPDGGPSSQFAAIYCNKSMDDRHKMAGTHSEPALLQIWDLGELECGSCPSTPPQLAYGIALDDGCIWDMKWCPSSAWELPSTCRKAPHMARLGLLAAALSSGKIVVYSLPHRDALMALGKSRDEGGVCQAPLICQVQRVAVLKVGSIQAGEAAHTGQCFCLDWMPVKPHNTLAAGFFDGSVALWNLNTKSALQRVRAPNGSVTLYPYHSFIAHDHIIQSLAWCRASSDFLATAGGDRKLKFWDLKKTYEPVSIHKRYLTTEICWPLIWSGILVGQQCCYATYGQHGMHYVDAGYLGYKPYFVAPRKATIWSTSFSDWLNSCVMSDDLGEVILMLLPDLSINPFNHKRPADRRFPVFRSEIVQFPDSESEECNGPEPETYSEAIKKYYLHFHDTNMKTFKDAQRRAPIKLMQATEVKGVMSLDKLPLASLFKVRLNPNLCCQSWMLSAGQAGLVRAHCLRTMNSPFISKMVRESEAQFAAMFPSQECTASQSSTMAVRHSTESTVEVL
ncbi:hypothetical protein GJAV_G00117770 [Gymnothorax javanicus]|nr:hypothetical protein GJAV_G00117770 [Gymnothorax javanicus]